MVSEKFTIEDIHQIRNESYQKRKDMSPKEIIEDTKKGAEGFKKKLADLKVEKKLKI
jgi:hypothetical protein